MYGKCRPWGSSDGVNNRCVRHGFFTASALNRIDDLKDGYAKFLSIIAVVCSWFLLFWLLVMGIGGTAFSETPALKSGMAIVFAAMAVPSLILIFDLMDDLEDCWNHDDFNPLIGLGWLALVIGIYMMIIMIGT